MNVKVIPKLYVQWLATVDQGKQVEFLEADSGGEEVVGGIEIGRVFADSKECVWAELYIGNAAIRVPLAVLREALEYAEKTVKSERYYDREYGDHHEGDA